MLTPTRIQIDEKDYEFIKKMHKALHYRSLSEYMREAVKAKISADRRKIKEMKRLKAMEMIGKAKTENLFETLEGEDFEDR